VSAPTPHPSGSASGEHPPSTPRSGSLPQVIAGLPSASLGTGPMSVLTIGIGVFALAVVTIVITAGYRGPRRH
jgi:hypothetical protein